MSEVLAKVVRQQADVAGLAEKRAEVLSCVEEFEAVRAECRWLSEYENDEMRYKVGQAHSQASATPCGRSRHPPVQAQRHTAAWQMTFSQSFNLAVCCVLVTSVAFCMAEQECKQQTLGQRLYLLADNHSLCSRAREQSLPTAPHQYIQNKICKPRAVNRQADATGSQSAKELPAQTVAD